MPSCPSHSASPGSQRGDQILNAEFFRSKGFSHVLQQSDITPKTMLEAIHALHADADVLRDAMKNSGISNGTQNVIQVIYSVLENNLDYVLCPIADAAVFHGVSKDIRIGMQRMDGFQHGFRRDIRLLKGRG